MSSQNNRLNKSIKLDLHSLGHNPKTPSDVFISLSEKSSNTLPIIKPLLERSLTKYRAIGMASCLSEYAGASILIGTSTLSDGRIHQWACYADEVDKIPGLQKIVEEMRSTAVHSTHGGPFALRPDEKPLPN